MVVTTGRADYGLLFPLLKRIMNSDQFELQFVATGTHLSQFHGKTLQLIEADNLPLAEIVEMTMSGDSERAICNSMAVGLIGFSQVFEKKAPDLVIVLGDRYELWPVCMSAVIHKVPIAHIHGGEATFGLIDDPIRHSITKMSTFHFASLELYARRIIQMGENPEHVFVVGAIGLDNIKKMPLMTKMELSEFAGVDFNSKVALMTYHPVTMDSYECAKSQITEVLNALEKTDLVTLMTMPNSDSSGNTIYQILESYCQKFPGKFKLVKSLGQKGYLSAMKYAQLMIGNSSSGILESASFKLPVVNIGDRQTGRFKPGNVIDCICKESAIKEAISKALSEDFRQSIAGIKSPFGDGDTSDKIFNILTSFDFSNKEKLLKKGFFELQTGLAKFNSQG